MELYHCSWRASIRFCCKHLALRLRLIISQIQSGTAAGCGTCTSTYGTIGTEGTNNLPPARWGSGIVADNAGYIWMFGGDNNPVGGSYMNDLWRFNTQNQRWTWSVAVCLCSLNLGICVNVLGCRMAGCNGYNSTGVLTFPYPRHGHSVTLSGGNIYVAPFFHCLISMLILFHLSSDLRRRYNK